MDTALFQPTQANLPPMEHLSTHPLMSWRSTIAGFLVSVVVMVALTALGMALGGANLDFETTFKGAGTFAGIWFIASSLVSVLIGSYFAARISRFALGRIGAAQGVIIASLFFGLLVWQVSSAIGWIGRGATSVVSGGAQAAMQATSQLSQSSMAGEIAEDALGTTSLSPERIQSVATGVASRLLNGNTDGAKSYLARQTGITSDEAEIKVNQLKSQMASAVATLRDASATALRTTGWAIFFALVLGVGAAAIGGALGSVTNAKHAPKESREEIMVGRLAFGD